MKRKIIKGLVLVLCCLCIINVNSQTPSIDITYPEQVVDVELYEMLEVQFRLSNFTYDNPFDPAEIDIMGYFTSPGGTIFKLPGFYYQNIYKQDDGGPNDYERLLIQSSFSWRLRFTPNETGSWEYYIVVTDHTGATAQTTPEFFNCTPGNSKGFIRKADDRYLVYDDGSQYFPVGTNLQRFKRYGYWSEEEYGTNSMKEFMDDMSGANINHVRLEINYFQGINLYGIDLTEGTNYYKYFNPKDSWQLDESVTYADSIGMTVSFAINSWQDMGDTNYSHNAWSDFNPYHKDVNNTNFYYSGDHAGNCDECWDIFRDPEALEVQKNLMRYIIARWSYATNLKSFIVWDEANQVDFHSFNPRPPELPYKQLIFDWHVSIIEHIKEVDPFDHLVNSGSSGTDFFKETEAVQSFDYYQGHIHTKMDYNFNFDLDKNVFNKVKDGYMETSLPMFVGEFSYFHDSFTVAYDSNGYGFHSVFWSSIFNGSLGIPLHWSYFYLDWKFPSALNRYIGVGNFAPLLPKLSDDLVPQMELDNNDFRVFYLTNNNATKLYGYMQDERYRFGHILSNIELREYLQEFLPPYPPRNENKSIVFDVTQSGDYIVKWYETTEGVLYDEEIVTINNPATQQLRIQLPPELHAGIFADGAFIIEYDCKNKWNNSLVNGSSVANVRSNSNIVTDSYGQPLFIGTDNDVRMMWFNGTYYQNVSLINGPDYSVRTNSGLAIDDKNRVYYIAAEDNKIHRLSYNLTTELWEDEILAQSKTYSVRPYSNLCVGEHYSVYFIDNGDDMLHALWLNNEIYDDAVVLPRADEVATTSLISADYSNNLYYIGMNDNKMHKLYWDWVLHQWDEIIVDWNHSTSMRPYSPIRVKPTNDRIYYIGNDNKIHEKREIFPGQYLDAIIASGNNYIVQSNSHLEFDSKNYLYFTSNKLINRAYWDAPLSTWLIEEIGDNFPENVNEYLCINNTDHIYYKGDDSRIHVDYFGCDDNYTNNITEVEKKSGSLSEVNETGNNQSNESDVLSENSVKVFPNPASKNVNITFVNLSGEKTVKLFSAQGRQVAKSSTFSNNITINVSDINPGVYIVIIKNNGEEIREKLIVE